MIYFNMLLFNDYYRTKMHVLIPFGKSGAYFKISKFNN